MYVLLVCACVEQHSMESSCHKDLLKASQKSLEITGKLVVIQFVRCASATLILQLDLKHCL